MPDEAYPCTSRSRPDPGYPRDESNTHTTHPLRVDHTAHRIALRLTNPDSPLIISPLQPDSASTPAVPRTQPSTYRGKHPTTTPRRNRPRRTLRADCLQSSVRASNSQHFFPRSLVADQAALKYARIQNDPRPPDRSYFITTIQIPNQQRDRKECA